MRVRLFVREIEKSPASRALAFDLSFIDGGDCKIHLELTPALMYAFSCSFAGRHMINWPDAIKDKSPNTFSCEDFRILTGGRLVLNQKASGVDSPQDYLKLTLDMLFQIVAAVSSEDGVNRTIVRVINHVYALEGDRSISNLDEKPAVLAAISLSQSIVPYERATDDLKNDIDVALATVGLTADYSYLSQTLRSNADFMRQAVRKDITILSYATGGLQENKSVILDAFVFGDWRRIRSNDFMTSESISFFRELIAMKDDVDSCGERLFYNVYCLQVGETDALGGFKKYEYALEKNPKQDDQDKVTWLINTTLAAYPKKFSSLQHYKRDVENAQQAFNEASSGDQLGQAVAVVQSLNAVDRPKGVYGDLNAMIMFLAVKLARYIRENIDRPSSSASPAVFSASSSQVSIDDLRQALSNLHGTTLAYREAENWGAAPESVALDVSVSPSAM